MPCGCQSACGCEIVAGPGLTTKVLGNKIYVTLNTSVGVPTFISQTDPGDLGFSYVWQETDADGVLVVTHTVVV